MKPFWRLLKQYSPSLCRSLLCSGLLLVLCALLQLSWPLLFVLPACLAADLLFTAFSPRLGFWKLLTLLLLALASLFFLVYLIFNDRDAITLRITLLLPSLLFLVGFVSLVFRFQNSLLVRGLFFVLLPGILTGFALYEIPLSKSVVWLLLISLFLLMVQLIEYYRFHGREQSILYLFPFLVLLSLILPALPVKDTPIRWEKVRSVFRYLEEQGNTLLVNFNFFLSDRQDTFSFKTSGFSEENTLSGGFLSNPALQLTVNGGRTHRPLYLAGSIYSDYSGTDWEKNTEKRPYSEPEYLLQNCQLTAAMEQYTALSADSWKYVTLHTYTVTYKGLKTKSIFYAPFTSRLTPVSKADIQETPYDTPLLSKAQSVGFTYKVLFLEPDLANPYFQDLLRTDHQEAFLTGSGATSPGLQKRQDYIHNVYTQLPPTLPSRVRELAAEVTAASETDYDRLLAIEDYLQSFPYSETPSPLPKGREFVDYFLFEEQTGYCTYFATSMAVLARCLDIPTRYVEGYLVPASTKYDRRDLFVYGSNAHAWVEAYLDGIGWIPFEPTPGYHIPVASWTDPSNKQRTSSGQGSSSEASPKPSPEQVTEDHSEKTGVNLPLLSGYVRDLLGVFLRVLFVLMPALGLLTLFLLIRTALRKKRYMLLDSEEKILWMMKQFLLLAGRYGFTMKEGETMSAFCLRLNGRLDTSASSFETLLTQYGALRFGHQKATEEMLTLWEGSLQQARRQFLRNEGLLKRLLYLIS